MTKLVILGRKNQTGNYETFFRKLPARTVTTLVPGEVISCDALILPGGGDITPAFFGEKNKGSRTVDTELDILQFQALDIAIAAGVALRTKRKIFSYKIQKPLLKRNLKKDA